MSALERIRVMLVDDHEIVRDGLQHFLTLHDDLELVGQAANGLEALDIAAKSQPDVILMDLVMPEMDGVEAIRRLRALYPAMQIVALTSFAERELVQQALAAGAIGFILKNASIDELSEAIHSAYQGRPTLAPEAFKVLVKSAEECPPNAAKLTPRELEVLKLMAAGSSNQQIAEHLVLNLSTVKTHVSNILNKLGAGNRVEAVTLAMRDNIINSPGE
ncbi:MAG: response regulator [Anaerolineae bacterium]